MVRLVSCIGVVTTVAFACLGCATSKPAGSTPPATAAVPEAGSRNTAEPVQPVSGADATRTIACATADVKLSIGRDNGDFNGMSHSGTYLTLTNTSRNACSIPGLPQLTFLDANGPVQTTADLAGTKLMHPGPQVLPIVLQPKQSVTTSARWVSGAVYPNSLCYKLTGVTLALRHETALAPIAGQMCGDHDKGVHYDLKRYGTGGNGKANSASGS